MKLIASHSGFDKSPVVGVKVDYSQFIPRGHYTRSELLTRYFKAMMWYGNVAIPIKNDDGTVVTGGVRQAILLGELFEGATGAQNQKLWNRVMDATSFLVGDSDSLSPMQLLSAARSAGGKKPEAAATGKEMDAVVAAIAKASPTKIVNGMHPGEISARMMGQRFVLDTFIMQNLVLPDVSDLDRPRNHPMGLDVAASFGNERARDLLDNLYNQKQFINYDTQLDKMKTHVANLQPAVWTSNAYYGWLDVLKRVVDVKPAGYPSFMLNDAWKDKSLNAALGSWAELRHDTILYTRQVSVECGGEGGDDNTEKPPTGYVEPDIKAYSRLKYLVNQITTGLGKLDLLDNGMKQHLGDYDELLSLLVHVCGEELSNQKLSSEEEESLRNIGDFMNRLNLFTEEVTAKVNGESVTEINTDSGYELTWQ